MLVFAIGQSACCVFRPKKGRSSAVYRGDSTLFRQSLLENLSANSVVVTIALSSYGLVHREFVDKPKCVDQGSDPFVILVAVVAIV